MYCANCGKQQTSDRARFCDKCGAPLGAPATVAAHPNANPPVLITPSDNGLKWILPVNRLGLAIVAGYAGLFTILIIPSPIVLIIGIAALLQLKKHPEKLGRGRAWFAVIAGALGTALMLWFLIYSYVTR